MFYRRLVLRHETQHLWFCLVGLRYRSTQPTLLCSWFNKLMSTDGRYASNAGAIACHHERKNYNDYVLLCLKNKIVKKTNFILLWPHSTGPER